MPLRHPARDTPFSSQGLVLVSKLLVDVMCLQINKKSLFVHPKRPIFKSLQDQIITDVGGLSIEGAKDDGSRRRRRRIRKLW
jgi:hypothetical protein